MEFMKSPGAPVHLNPYRAPHRAIRVALGRLVESAGQTDFADRAAFERFRVQFGAVVQMLATHARIEVQFLDPLVGVHDHERAATIQRDHASLERELHAVSSGIHVIDGILEERDDADPESARERGHALYLELTRFTAHYFEHLIDEEVNVLPILVKRVDPAVIDDALARARASVEPVERARTMALMIAAMPRPERAAFVRAAGKGALDIVARLALDDVEWAALSSDLE